jgi:hypothetical protein
VIHADSYIAAFNMPLGILLSNELNSMIGKNGNDEKAKLEQSEPAHN